MSDILGIHHMSAICGPAQENLDFYTGVLGLRLVKFTVDFDDPSAYHLYYGDAQGNPGTLLTFFPFPDGHPGRAGAGQATVTRLTIPDGALSYWLDRFKTLDVDYDRPNSRDGKDHLRFRAPDGLSLELVGARDSRFRTTSDQSGIPPGKGIVGIESIALSERRLEPTQAVLEDVLGFRLAGERNGKFRFEAAGGGPGRAIEISVEPEGPAARQGHGTVHHIAFRVPNDAAQARHRQAALERGLDVSPVMDRKYFRSIYFREPGGVLFEIATDAPGFSVDEPAASLGSSLKLPAELEPLRFKIERSLPPLRLRGTRA